MECGWANLFRETLVTMRSDAANSVSKISWPRHVGGSISKQDPTESRALYGSRSSKLDFDVHRIRCLAKDAIRPDVEVKAFY